MENAMDGKTGTFSRTLAAAVAMLLMAAPCVRAMAMSAVPLITKEDLRAKLDNPEVMVLDVRTGDDWKSAQYKIKGSVRLDPKTFSTWADTLPRDKTIVFY
jgi:hypothetical protein